MVSISDRDCVSFLQANLPKLHLRWAGYRKVRRQVRKRLQRRLEELGFEDLSDYTQFLQAHTYEWQNLEQYCRITISRFYRDRQIFETLRHEVLPHLAQEAGDTLRLWSAGCASGEEAYSLALIWHLELAAQFPQLHCQLLASDSNPAMLARAERAIYRAGALKELPSCWRETAFRQYVPVDFDHSQSNSRTDSHQSSITSLWELKPSYRADVQFVVHDLRTAPPAGSFHLICCRNLAFTYFDLPLQQQVLQLLLSALMPGGVLVIGGHEQLPANELLPWSNSRGIFCKQR